MADDLAALVADERYSPPPLPDPALHRLSAERRATLMAAIAALARALDQEEIARHARRRAAATQRYATSHPREGVAA